MCKNSTNKSQLHLDKLGSWCNDNDMLPKPEKYHIMNISFLKKKKKKKKKTAGISKMYHEWCRRDKHC